MSTNLKNAIIGCDCSHVSCGPSANVRPAKVHIICMRSEWWSNPIRFLVWEEHWVQLLCKQRRLLKFKSSDSVFQEVLLQDNWYIYIHIFEIQHMHTGRAFKPRPIGYSDVAAKSLPPAWCRTALQMFIRNSLGFENPTTSCRPVRRHLVLFVICKPQRLLIRASRCLIQGVWRSVQHNADLESRQKNVSWSANVDHKRLKYLGIFSWTRSINAQEKWVGAKQWETLYSQDISGS